MTMVGRACRAHDRVGCAPWPPPVMLAVSDDDLRAVLRMLFEDAGYRVVEASSGLTAFTHLEQSQVPLVVLLDRYLRGARAAEQLLELAVSGQLARHRFVFLTPDGQERLPQLLRRHITSQAIPVLAMPFEFDDMLRKIARAQLQLL